MEIKSEQKHILISPRKVRPVADIIKKMSPLTSLEKLPFIKKRGAEFLLKVVKSAIANASQRGIDPARLVFKEIQIGEGPRLKRGQPVSRGRWHPVKKRMSHIKVILETKVTEEQKKEKKVEVKAKVQKKPEVKEVKVKAEKTVKKRAVVSKKKGIVKNESKN